MAGDSEPIRQIHLLLGLVDTLLLFLHLIVVFQEAKQKVRYCVK